VKTVPGVEDKLFERCLVVWKVSHTCMYRCYLFNQSELRHGDVACQTITDAETTP